MVPRTAAQDGRLPYPGKRLPAAWALGKTKASPSRKDWTPRESLLETKAHCRTPRSARPLGDHPRAPGCAAPPRSRDSYLPSLAHWPMNAEYSSWASANSPLAKRACAIARAAGLSPPSRPGRTAITALPGWKRNHSYRSRDFIG